MDSLSTLRQLAMSIVLLAPATAIAGTLTYTTGAALLSDPNVAFPVGSPTLSGDSLMLGPIASNFPKLMVIPLISAGVGPTTITVTANLTRLTAEFDPHLTIGDGAVLTGITPADFGAVVQNAYYDLGNAGQVVPDPPGIQPGSTYPGIGQSMDLTMTVTLNALTTLISFEALGVSGSFISPLTLSTGAPLSFVFLGDNEDGEAYQINSLTISGPAIVPIPATAWLFGSALGVMGWMRRKTSA